MKRILIKSLEENVESEISGFIKTIRDTKYMIFIVLEDRSGEIQVSIDKEQNKEIIEVLDGVLANSVIKVLGVMKKSEYVKNGGREFIPNNLEILSKADALPLDETANIDTRLDYRWIDLRSERNHLIFKVQTAFVEGMRNFLISQDFVEIHTPKLIATASESGSEVFEVKYFNEKAFLAQSPQFYKQMAMASGIWN